MIDGETSNPNDPPSLAKLLLDFAERNPDTRRALIELWARVEVWEHVEGIALAWTLDPNMGNADLVRRPKQVSLPTEARHYLEMANRSPVLFSQRVTPARFIAWAHSVELAFHPDWHLAAEQAAVDMLQAGASEANRRRVHLIRSWARAPYWSAEEIAVLAYDLDPKDEIKHSATGHDSPTIRRSPDARQLLVQVRRAIEVGSLKEKPAPLEVLKWTRSVGHDFHPDWWAAVSAETERAVDEVILPKPAVQGLDLKTREQETLLKMVAGMAMAYHGWDRDAFRNPATAEIANELLRVGISLHPDTIRKWLRKCAEFVPKDSA